MTTTSSTSRPSSGRGTGVRHRFTTRADGDLLISGDAAVLAARRSALVDHPWTWLRQVHGADVVVVDAPGAMAGTHADAAVTAVPGAVLAVHVADCAPVLFADEHAGVIGAAHAGWKGLAAGVLAATTETMRALGAESITATLGPCIHVGCYEFGATDLDTVAAACGEAVRGTTTAGTPGLDLPAGVRAALTAAGVERFVDESSCTACDGDRHWSHRARADAARQAGLIWIEP